MNKLLLCLFLTIAGSTAYSQKIYFVYLQSESEQPFFVKLNNKVHSSTGSGYLILSRMKDSVYNLSVGFPDAKWPEQTFSIAINKKDRGYLLKNFGEKGWGLFDLQSLSVQMSTSAKAAIINTPGPGEVSAFTDILAKAADDPSLKDKPVRPKPEIKKETAVIEQPVKKEETTVAIKEPVDVKKDPIETAVVKKDEPIVQKTEPVITSVTKKEDPVATKTEPVETAVVKKEEPIITKPVETAVVKKEEVKADPVVTEPALTKKEEVVVENKTEAVKKEAEDSYTKSEVTKGSSSDVAEGHDIVFIDNYENGKKDTIRVLIPNPKPLVEPVREQPKEEKKFLEINNSENTKKEETVKTENPVPSAITEIPQQKEKEQVKKEEIKTDTPAKTPVVNNCATTAEENEFLKLRRKMAAAKEDDEMVSEARKYFKSTCFTVYQIRNLSTLFLTDEGKYKFFDAAYAHASDAHNFISLQLELKDEYYVKRFKAMLK